MDIELIRNIDTEVIENLVAKSDLYEIILLDKGKYVSHFGLSKPFVIKVFHTTEMKTVTRSMKDLKPTATPQSMY